MTLKAPAEPVDSVGESAEPEVLLDVRGLVVQYKVGRGQVAHAVSNVDLTVRKGETLGLVGESGCGKSTLAKALVRLVVPNEGSIEFEGTNLVTLSERALRSVRTKLQMIFQDPISSLNPRRKAAAIVEEPLKIWGGRNKAERRRRVIDLLEQVGIDPDAALSKRPHEFSGGQCQRLSIGRALAMEPKMIICDEPVSALDVSVQAQVLNLLRDLKEMHGLTLLFVSHDLAVVKNVSDRVAVMYLGKIVEIGPVEELYESPRHPYTIALLRSVPGSQAAEGATLQGELPSPIKPPSGCRFRTRCPLAQDICSESEPALEQVAGGHRVACHFPVQPLQDHSAA